MPIYTREGDEGFTSAPYFGRSKIPKDHVVIEAIGDLDELTSMLGLARSLLPKELLDLNSTLKEVQLKLFDIGTLIATCQGKRVENDDVALLESLIDKLSKDVLRPYFIVPGGHPAAAALHVARAVCRRFERRLVTLSRLLPNCVDSNVLRYVNRLSDYLYVAALYVNKVLGISEERIRH